MTHDTLHNIKVDNTPYNYTKYKVQAYDKSAKIVFILATNVY